MKMRKQIRLFLIIIAALFLIFLGVWSTRNVISRPRIDLSLEGSSTILNGQEKTYRLAYRNDSKNKLINVELQVNLPSFALVDGSESPPLLVKTIGDLDSGGRGDFDLNLTLFGETNEIKRVSAKLIYQPQDASSLFEIAKSIDITVEGDSLDLSFSAADFDSFGRFTNTLTIINKTAQEVKNAKLKIVYPENFKFITANPTPKQDDNVWIFDSLAAATTSTIELTGRILGATSNLKPFHATVTTKVGGSEVFLAETSSLNQIVTSGLVIFQKINNNRPLIANWGDTLQYDISYKNATDTPLNNLLIEIKFDAILIDINRSNFGGGNFDATSGILSFDKANHRSLAKLNANQEDSLAFSVALVELPPFLNQSSKNLTFKTIATIKGFDNTAVGQDIIEMKIKTKPFIVSRIYYQNQYFANSGPVPPQVGQKTTYTVVWELSNVSNDLTNILVETFLGPNVVWEGNISPKNAKISYNNELRKVVWNVGLLRAGTGFTRPIKQVIFQIALSPTQEQIGQLALLIGQTKLAGIDDFTSNSVNVASEPTYSNLPDDPLINNRGIVQP